jgi:dihydrofolate reductase
MSRLIQWNVITLDGFFEGPTSWELDWHQSVLGDEFYAFALEQLENAGMLLFGRTTYEGMAAYWQNADDPIAPFMNARPKTVFSHTLTKADWNNTTLAKCDAVSVVRELKAQFAKQQPGKDIFVFGSGQLSASLLEAGLFDEIRIALAPIVLGRGKTLFGRDLTQVRMQLLEARPFANGCVLLRYEPKQ